MSIVRDFWNNVVGTADGAVDSVQQTVSTTVDTVTDNASSAVKTVTDNAAAEVQTVTNTASTVVNRVTDNASAAVKSATENAAAEVQTVTNIASGVVNTVTDNASAAVSTATDNAAARVKTVTSNASAAIKSVTDNPDVLSATDDASAAINTATDDASTAIKNTTDDAASAVKTTADDAAAGIKTVTDDATTVVKTTTDDASAAIKTTTDDASAAIKTATDDASSAVKTATDDASAAIKTTTDDASAAVKEARDRVSGAIDSATAEVNAATDDASAAVKGARDFVSGEIDAVTDSASGVVKSVAGDPEGAVGAAASNVNPSMLGANLTNASLLSSHAPFPTDLIKELKAVDPSGIAAAAKQIGVAVGNLTNLEADYRREALFEGGPNKHEWWNLWGLVGTTEEQKIAERLLENAAKTSELISSLTELGTGVTTITAQVQAWTSSLPDIEPAETPAGELAEKLEHVGQVLGWVNAAVQGANAIGQAMAASNKLAEFQKDPTSKTAEEWAEGVGKVFEGLGDTVGAIPGFPAAEYWKGLLKAPKAIIGAFIAVQHAYYAKIDEAMKDRGAGSGKVMQPGTSSDDPINQ